MNKTTNYNLNQWDADDRVTREDFNADNAAIDAALAAVASAASGGAKIAWGTYIGDGKDGAMTFTFSFEPKLMVVMEVGASVNATFTPTVPEESILLFVRPVANFLHRTTIDGLYTVTVTWNGNTVSWNQSSSRARHNAPGVSYAYVALG